MPGAHLALQWGGRTLCGASAEMPTDLATFSDEACADCAATALAGGVRAVAYGGVALGLARVLARDVRAATAVAIAAQDAPAHSPKCRENVELMVPSV